MSDNTPVEWSSTPCRDNTKGADPHVSIFDLARRKVNLIAAATQALAHIKHLHKFTDVSEDSRQGKWCPECGERQVPATRPEFGFTEGNDNE